MKRSLQRRIADARHSGPVYRDVHPDREPMALYNDDGTLAIQSDLPSSMMRAVRKQAKRIGVSRAELLVTILQHAIDKHQRGF